MAAYTTIDDPEAYFQVKLYTGTGTSTAFTLDGDTNMQPDLVWIKNRGSVGGHRLHDAVREAGNMLESNSSGAETDDSAHFTSFNSDGFTVAGTNTSYNTASDTYVAWCWKANGSGSSNTDGSINTAATSASTVSGFSINSFTGNETSGATIGHGLGAVPRMIISKDLGTNSWYVYHAGVGDEKALRFDTDDTPDDSTTYWNDTTPTSSVYTVGSNTGTNDSNPMVSYCFADVQGFSSMGSYIGNGNADGTFVYTGFRPAFLWVKNTTGGNGGEIRDNKRPGYNGTPFGTIYGFGNYEEVTGENIELFSNGFKCQATGGGQNASGSVYVYMAFAEAPFVNSNGVPCNAR